MYSMYFVQLYILYIIQCDIAWHNNIRHSKKE